jgi:hypothetical protein
MVHPTERKKRKIRDALSQVFFESGLYLYYFQKNNNLLSQYLCKIYSEQEEYRVTIILTSDADPKTLEILKKLFLKIKNENILSKLKKNLIQWEKLEEGQVIDDSEMRTYDRKMIDLRTGNMLKNTHEREVYESSNKNLIKTKEYGHKILIIIVVLFFMLLFSGLFSAVL